jgi:hypothetical protein
LVIAEKGKCLKVKMLCPVVNGNDSYARGAEYDVSDELGESMVASGQAVAEQAAPAAKAPKRQRKAVSGPPENKR